MAPSKKTNRSAALESLKQDLKNGTVGQAYLFYGEETYLREHYLSALRTALVPPAFSAFNYHQLEGRGLTMQALEEAVEVMPMMAERTLVVVTDWDLFALPEPQRQALISLLEDMPPYCCLVFVYDTVAYQPNRTMKRLMKAISQYVAVVEFQPAERDDLLRWVGRHFRSLHKEIDRATAEHLIFTCGDLMTGLVPEISKIAAYAKGPSITRQDIDAVADPVLSARVFHLTDAVIQGDHDRSAALLADLLKQQQEPILLLAALGSQLRKLYTACLALRDGRGRDWLTDLWGMKSDYQAKLLLSAARRTTVEWCADAVTQCQRLDLRMKSEAGLDPQGELKLLLARLEARQ